MANRLYEAQWEMPSHSRPNVFYTVSKRYDGGWECDCKSWIFQRKKYGPNFECKHIIDVKHNRDYHSEVIEVQKRNVRGIRLGIDGKIASFLETLGPPVESSQATVTVSKYTIILTSDHINNLRKGNVIPVVQEILSQVDG